MNIKIFNVTDEDVFLCSSSSKGNQSKWKRDNFFIKQDYLGYESIAEIVSAKLASCIENFNYVDYNLCSVIYNQVQYNDCCYSKNFLSNGEVAQTLYRLFEFKDIDLDEYISNTTTDIAILKIKETLNLDDKFIEDIGKMLFFDALILNEDRHFNNICFIISSNGNLRLTPIFDNGGALLSDIRDYPLITQDFINVRNVKSKPFNTKFSNQIKGVLKLGVSPLKIDRDKFNNLVKDLKVCFEYEPYLNRAIRVVNMRLNELEGKVWQSI